MEILQIEEASNFLNDQKVEKNVDDTLCIRCLRKKFKCMIIYALLFIVIFQIVLFAIEKLSENNINLLFEKFIKSPNSTSNFVP